MTDTDTITAKGGPYVLRTATQAVAGSDLDQLRATGARLLERAQVALQAAQAAYVVDQAKLQAEQTRQLDELSTRLREERRGFELSRQRELAQLSSRVQLLLDARDLFDGDER